MIILLCVGFAEAQTHPAQSQAIGFAYWVNDSSLKTSIVLNNTTEHAISVSPVFYNLNGQALTAAPVSVPARGQVNSDLGAWIAAAGGAASHTTGSLILSYTAAHAASLGAQLYVNKAAQSLSFDVHGENLAGFGTSELRSVWWLRGTNSVFNLVLTNTTGSAVSATATFTAQGSGTIVETYALTAHQTRVIDVGGLGAPTTVTSSTTIGSVRLGGIAISHTGIPGAVIACGMVSAPGGFSSEVQFADPMMAVSNKAIAIHALIGTPDVATLSPSLSFGSAALLSNAATVPITVTPRVVFKTAGNATHTVTLPTVYLVAQQVAVLDVKAALAQAGFAGPFRNASVTFTWDGPGKALVGMLTSVDSTGSHVFDVPLKDPESPMNNYGGSYPWSLIGDNQSVVHLVNSGVEEAAFVVRIDTSSGAFIPGAITLEPGQASALDIREIRDSQIADPAGRTIPLSATEGRFFWREFGSTGLVGRLEPYNPTVATAASYSCPPDCCLSSTEDLQIAPAVISGNAGTQQQIRLWADVQYGCDPFPMVCDVTRRGHFSTEDETIASVTKLNSVATVTFRAAGDTGIIAWVRAQECSGPPPCPGCPGAVLNPGCSCIPNVRVDAPTAPTSSALSIAGISHRRWPLFGGDVTVRIFGAGFGTDPSEVSVAISGAGVEIEQHPFFPPTDSEFEISISITDANTGGGNHTITVTRRGKSATVDIYFQIPTKLVRQEITEPVVLGPPTYGPIPSPDPSAPPHAASACGAYRFVTYKVMDQDAPAQEIDWKVFQYGGSFRVDEVFALGDDCDPVGGTYDYTHTLVYDVIAIFVANPPPCPSPNTPTVCTQTFVFTANGKQYTLTTKNKMTLQVMQGGTYTLDVENLIP
ncbi:MAG: hypothetical protein IT175_17245 [Acidobacteria bacterium]|nr:hypothetical protein [Acidobacteriota bacterium]